MKRTTRRRLGAAAVAVSGSLLLSGCQSNPGQAAIVGNESISTDQLGGVLQRSLQTACGQQYADQPLQLERLKLTQLVRADLLDQWARQHGITVTTDDVDNYLATIYDEFGFQQAAQLQFAQTNAVAAPDIPAQVRAVVLQQKVADRLTQHIQVSDQQLQQYYQQNKQQLFEGRARGIVVADQATAQKLAAQLKQNPNQFGQLLQQTVQQQNQQGKQLNATASVQRGGYLGKLPLGLFEANGLPTAPGSIITVQGPTGWYVLQILDNQSFAQIRAQVRRDYLSQQRSQALTGLLQQLAKQTKVDVNPRFGQWNANQGLVVPPNEPALSASPQPVVGSLNCQQQQG